MMTSFNIREQEISVENIVQHLNEDTFINYLDTENVINENRTFDAFRC